MLLGRSSSKCISSQLTLYIWRLIGDDNIDITMSSGGLIPNLPVYHEGELFHSYLNRVAIANSFSSALEMFSLVYQGQDNVWYKNQRLGYDCMKPATRIIKRTDGIDWILSGTLFKGRAPFIDRMSATRRISCYNRPSGIKNSQLIPSFIQELRICPECRKEEGEQWYFHTDHQMPHVKVCPKHGCALRLYTGTPYMEHYEDCFVNIEPTKAEEILSVFESDFFNRGLQCSSQDIQNYIRKKLHEPRFALTEKFLDAGVLTPLMPTKSHFLDDKYNILPSCSTFPLLAYLAKDVSSLEEEIVILDSQKKSFEQLLETEYILKSEYREDLVTVQCLGCGTVYSSTPTAIVLGCGCPVCESNIAERELIRRMVYSHSRGLHIPVGSELGWNKRMTCKGKDSQKTISMTPKKYFVRDSFSQNKRLEKYRNEVEKLGDFTFLDALIKNDQVCFKIRHNKCGGEFEVFRTNLSSVCRVCEARLSAKDFFLNTLKEEAPPFSLIGEFSENYVVVSDTENRFEGKPRTVLARIKRLLHPTDREYHKKEYELIDKKISSLKGTIISIDDLAGITDRRTLVNYICRLCKKGILKRLAIGLVCHKDEEYSLLDIQKKSLYNNENSGCPIGDSALISFGETIEKPNHAFALNYTSERNIHKRIGGSCIGSPKLFYPLVYIDVSTKLEMTFVASVWHSETFSSPDKHEALIRLLSYCITSGTTTERIMALGDKFPLKTRTEVRRFIKEYEKTFR